MALVKAKSGAWKQRVVDLVESCAIQTSCYSFSEV